MIILFMLKEKAGAGKHSSAVQIILNVVLQPGTDLLSEIAPIAVIPIWKKGSQKQKAGFFSAQNAKQMSNPMKKLHPNI